MNMTNEDGNRNDKTKMKEKLKILFYGMSIHPGNLVYFFFVFVLPFAALGNKKYTGNESLIFAGVIFLAMIVVFLPLYIYTSYDIGKINKKYMDENNNK